MSLFKQFETDAQKEKEGIAVTYAPNEDGTVPTFHIRRSGPSNPEYVKALERESAPYRRLLELNALDSKTQEKIMRRVFCSSVLTGFENVQDKSGATVPFNRDNALKLFDALPELYYDLAQQASRLSSFRVETQESDAKN